MKPSLWGRICLPILLTLLPVPGSAKDKLFVFFPSLVRPLSIHKSLSQQIPEAEVRVFARFEDFQAMVQVEHPAAILAQPLVLKDLMSYKLTLQGTRKGEAGEPCVLLSLDSAVDLSRMGGAVIGVVSSMERDSLDSFVKRVVPGSPRIRRATKVEDLLPMLIFRSVSAALVEETTVEDFRKKSQAKLVGTRLANCSMERVGLAIRQGGPKEALIREIKKIKGEDLALLGVDAWK